MPLTATIALAEDNYTAQTIHEPLIASVPSLRLVRNSSPLLSAEHLLCDASIDAVVATQESLALRTAFIRDAIAAGKHVMATPPLAASADEMESLMELARRKERVLCPFLPHRYDGDYNTVAKLLKVDREVRIGRWDALYANVADGQCGIGWWDMLDQTLHLFGAPTKVVGSAGACGGAVALIELDYACATAPKQIRLSIGKEQGFRFEIRAEMGGYQKTGVDPQQWQLEKGVSPLDETFGIEDPRSHGILFEQTKDGPRTSRAYPTITTPFWRGLYDDFASAMRGERDTPNPPEDARDAMRIYEAAQRSIEQGGEPVELEAVS